MSEQPFWQIFAISEPEELILPATNRFYAFILMSIAIIVISFLTIYVIANIRKQSATTGSKARFYYIAMFIGLFMLTLNSAIIRISIYFLEGKYTILSQEKAILFFGGAAVFIFGLTNVSFSIIDFRKSTKKILKAIYWLFVSIAVLVLIVQILLMSGFEQMTEIILSLQSFSVVLALTLLTIFIFALFFEARSNPSKIEQLRLNLLSSSVILLEILFFANGATSIFKDPNSPEIFIALTTYIVPITYVAIQPIVIMLLYWSLLTPNWLLVKSGVIQPSFRDFLKKRKAKKGEA